MLSRLSQVRNPGYHNGYQSNNQSINQWYESIVSINGINQRIQWYQSTIQWYHSINQWYQSIVSINGIHQWYSSMVSINGFNQWYQSMVTPTPTSIIYNFGILYVNCCFSSFHGFLIQTHDARQKYPSTSMSCTSKTHHHNGTMREHQWLLVSRNIG